MIWVKLNIKQFKMRSEDRKLTPRDISRKSKKLEKSLRQLEGLNKGTKKYHRKMFKAEKTLDQLQTGKSGIRPNKSAFNMSGYKLPHMAAPLNNNHPGGWNSQVVGSAGDPVVNESYPVDKFKQSMKSKAAQETSDPELADFFSGIHILDNPEYASYTKKLNPDSKVFGELDVTGTTASESEAARSEEYDFFIKNRNTESDKVAKQMIDLQKGAKEARSVRDFDKARGFYKQQNALRDMMKKSIENYSPSADLEKRMKN